MMKLRSAYMVLISPCLNPFETFDPAPSSLGERGVLFDGVEDGGCGLVRRRTADGGAASISNRGARNRNGADELREHGVLVTLDNEQRF